MKICVDCKQPTKNNHKEVKRCRPCHNIFVGKNKIIRVCIDCGQPISDLRKVTKRCQKCYLKTFNGKGNPNWRGSSICIKCGGKRIRHNKTKLCGDCYREKYIKGLPECIGCGRDLSRHDSLKVGTGYCRICYRGDKTKRWNPNLSMEFRKNGRRRNLNPEYYEWHKKVFERDKYTCQKCSDNKGNNLIAHHIQSFSTAKELRTDLKNGITFCDKCHRKFHNQFGYFDNFQEQLDEFLQKQIIGSF